MTYDEWREEKDGDIDTYNFPDEAMKMAWNAAIESAVTSIENADYNDDCSGISANGNAQQSVENLRAT